jgi:anthranilate phosphoribosyltransferase
MKQRRKQKPHLFHFNAAFDVSNPLQVKRQVIGVYSFDKARLMASALEQFDVRHVMLVSARDGLDELSITAPTDIIELKNSPAAGC